MYHIAVDAGGTKTYAAVMDHDNTILFEVKKGQGNVAHNYKKSKNK